MDIINVNFFGIPSVIIDNNCIELPYAKAEAVLYLLLYEKVITREVLSSLLWGDMDDQSAKKNLRNAIYIVRKQTLDDIIISPKRSILQLNKKYKIVSDVDYMNKFNPCEKLTPDCIKKFLNCYNGSFIENLKTKSNLEYTEWADAIGTKLNITYVNKLKILSNKLIEDKNYYYGEICCRKLIELEEYEETGYANLMKIHKYQNKHQESIDIYKKLSEKLNNELSVKPSKEINKIYKEIVNDIKIKLYNEKDQFLGRDNEKKNIYNNIYQFIEDKPFKSILIYGEDGIGKSLLLNKIASDFDFNVLLIRVNCYEYESDFIFKLWDKVFKEITNIIKENNFNIPKALITNIAKSFPTLDIGINNDLSWSSYDTNHNFTEKSIFDLFTLLSNKLKIIFIIDDLNNADKASLELLYKTVLENRNRIMLIASSRDLDEEMDDKFYHLLRYNNMIEKISLNRFNKDETKEFVNQIMPDAISLIDKIYSESEGNPLFVIEIINSIRNGNSKSHMTNKIENLIKVRLHNLSNESYKLLSICSLFHYEFDIEMLINITGLKAIELIDIVDELLTKGILKEEVGIGKSLGLNFTHGKIREYTYNEMSNSKRLILHGKIAEYYETELLNNERINRTLYPELIYHLASSNNNCKLFKYKTRWLQEILNVNHEIFPIVENNIPSRPGLIEYYLDEESLDRELESLNNLHKRSICKRCDDCLEEEIIYLYLYGRFNKNRGNYQDGQIHLNEMVHLAEKNKYYEYAYKGYLQLGHHYLNINDLSNMEKAINKSEEFAKLLEDKCKVAIAWRLKGYLYILLGKYEQGEEYINKAFEIFNLSLDKERYLLNMVASLYYLGESYRLQGLYVKALEYYNSSLNLSIDEEDCPAAGLIFSKIGFVKYKQDIIDEAQYYYLKSLKAYEKNIFVWGKAEVYYYLFTIYNKKNMIAKSKKYLNQAFKYADKYSSKEIRDNIYNAFNMLNQIK